MFAIFAQAFPPFFSRIVYWELRQIWPLFIRLLVSGQLATGNARDELGRVISTAYSVPDVLLLNSGSAALVVALQALHQIHPQRQRVLVPVYICPSVIRAIRRANLQPQFVAIERDLNVAPEAFRNISGPSDVLAAIIPHLYGYPARIAACAQAIKQTDPSIFILDDAAAGFDTCDAHQRLGAWGDVGIFSFNSAKKLTASGGGALMVSNPTLLAPLQEQKRVIPEPSTPEVLAKFISFWWNVVCFRSSPTLNYWVSRILPTRTPTAQPPRLTQLSNLDAALILWLLHRQAPIHARRNEIIRLYVQALNDCPGMSFPQDLADTFSVSRFYLRVAGLTATHDAQGALQQDNPFVAYLKQRGIRAGYGYAIPDEMFDPEGRQLRHERFAWLDELIWLPVDHKQDVRRYETVIQTIHAFFETR